MKTLTTKHKALLTGGVILVVIGWFCVKYWDYITNPWTRNGQVMAQVIQITPRVSGTIFELPVEDNQFVKAGDLLFQIDPRTFQSEVDEKAAILEKVKDEIETLKREVGSRAAAIQRYASQADQAKSQIKAFSATLEDTSATYNRMLKAVRSGAVSRDMLGESRAQYQFAEARVQHARDLLLEAEASKLQAEIDLERAKADLGALGDANARLRAAKAALHHAELELEFTEVRAMVDGYVTNLNLRLGDHAHEGHAVMAFVDVESYWITGFFKENSMEDVRPGNRAIITLMSAPDQPIEGYVHSIGWGVAQKDGQSDKELLPIVQPNFEWIRLAQRIPVRIHPTDVPEGVDLRVGTTGTVLVLKDTQVEKMEEKKPVPPAPRAVH